MQRATVVATNQTRSLAAFRVHGHHVYAVAELLNGWAPEIGEKVTGDLTSLGGSDLVCDDGTNARVLVHRFGCNIEDVREMLR